MCGYDQGNNDGKVENSCRVKKFLKLLITGDHMKDGVCAHNRAEKACAVSLDTLGRVLQCLESQIENRVQYARGNPGPLGISFIVPLLIEA